MRTPEVLVQLLHVHHYDLAHTLIEREWLVLGGGCVHETTFRLNLTFC